MKTKLATRVCGFEISMWNFIAKKAYYKNEIILDFNAVNRKQADQRTRVKSVYAAIVYGKLQNLVLG